MKNLHLLYLIATVLTGCATAKQITGPNGTPAYSIRCGAAAPDACLEKAGEVCPNGYVVLNAQGSKYLGQFGSGSVSGQLNQMGGGVAGSTISTPLITPNTLLIECKPPK